MVDSVDAGKFLSVTAWLCDVQMLTVEFAFDLDSLY